jgi:5-formyltetrahydrofolate cyclo-ligase
MRNVRIDKIKLRSVYYRIRGGIQGEERNYLDQAITHNLLNWERFRRARCVFCYVGFKSEINTSYVLRAALMQGKTVAVPRVVDPIMRIMKASVIEDLQCDLAPGYAGILEPEDHCQELNPEEIDFIIAPGLAFTPRGYRLGYGGGFYDRFLKNCRRALTCALTYRRLIVPKLPINKNDVRVDYLVTEYGIKKTNHFLRI